MHTYDRTCQCRMGWTGRDCEQCTVPYKGYRFICVATAAHTGHPYMLAYVTERQFDNIMSGKVTLDWEARHRSIEPNHKGYDGRTYDCECRPVDPMRRKRNELTATSSSISAYDALVSRYLKDSEFDSWMLKTSHGMVLRETMTTASDCTIPIVSTIVLAVLAALFLALMIIFLVQKSQLEKDLYDLRTGQRSAQEIAQTYQGRIPPQPDRLPGVSVPPSPVGSHFLTQQMGIKVE